MKIHSLIGGILAGGCAIGMLSPLAMTAAVSDDDFNALKDAVQQLGDKVKKLEQIHQQDQQQIQQLQQQVQEAQKTATNAALQAEAAKVQSIHPVPAGVSATKNFTMVGDAEVQFGKVHGHPSAFVLADFAPIFLFRGGDKVLFEAGLDITLQNGARPEGGSSTTVELGFATLDYLINDYATFVGGKMLLPLGTYSERSAGWLNKIPDDPLPREILPATGVGVQLRGGIPIGEAGQQLTYSAYGVNGPSSKNGTGNHDQLDLTGNVGITSDGVMANLHSNPSGGGRLGWFYPWKAHYDVELGLSGQSGQWSDNGHQHWTAGVVDAALHITPYFEARGEYMHTWVQTADIGTFRPQGWWVQASYKLAGLNLNLPLINNLEPVGRYDQVLDGLGTTIDRYTMGFVYYLSNTLWLEGDYEFFHSRGQNPNPTANKWVFQISYGF